MLCQFDPGWTVGTAQRQRKESNPKEQTERSSYPGTGLTALAHQPSRRYSDQDQAPVIPFKFLADRGVQFVPAQAPSCGEAQV